MKNNFITEISLEDFKRLNLIGYRNTRIDCDDNTYHMEMTPVYLNEELKSNIEWCEEEGWDTIAVAIHTEPTEDDIKRNMEYYTFDSETHEKRKYNKEEAYKLALLDCSYLDKFMNRFSGHQTFQIGCNINHLYSNRDYWYITDDYWRVKKRETKAIYLIHLE